MKVINLLLPISLAALVVACGKEEPKLAQTLDAGVVIQEVKVGAADAGSVEPKQALMQNKPIRVEIRSVPSNSPKVAKVDVKLIELKTGLVAGTATGQLSGSGESAVVELKSSNEWPTGRYLIEVRIDGKLSASRDIDVFGASM
ncbi:hypothetical protein VDG09_03200 [Xanthomonas campestris pv. raphani]|uniref:hypothetical protein n=1 Tax=Xanthomonas campestris TaxID=339 RepID=UPI00128FF954|nr:hypothetical protein [Xanthomonas campestris]MEA9826670.1 hypothetical protein [Xanthomonas campestris pv. raphani]